MKKALFILSTFVLLTISSPYLKAASVLSKVDTASTITMATEQKAILARVYEIKKMDKSNLTSLEKKGLRKELKGLKKKYRESGGIYLSVGAIIIVILLLILLIR